MTKHIIINASDLPGNIKRTINDELLKNEYLNTLTLHQVSILLKLIEQVSTTWINRHLSSEY